MRRLLFPHLALWIAGIAVLRIAVVPAEICPPATPAAALEAAVDASDWLVRNMSGDGRFAYGYLKDRDAVPAEYNAVRHAGAVFTLYMLARTHPGYLDAADAGLAVMTGSLVAGDGWRAFALPGEDVKLGANGLFLVSLAQRRAATGDTGHDDLMRDIGRFLVGQQQADGSMLAFWDQRTGAPVPDTYGIFATGEAFWGLTFLHTLFPAEGWDGPALAVAHYLATERDRKEGEVARYPDHWAAYGMAELAAAGVHLDDTLVGYARALAGFFSMRIRVESQRTGEGINLWVRWHPGPPSGLATAAEGMGALWHLAGRDPRLADMRPGMEDDLACAAGMMVDRQFTAADAAAFPRPGLVEGAWFYRDYSQVDDQQHTIAALLQMQPALGGDDG